MPSQIKKYKIFITFLPLNFARLNLFFFLCIKLNKFRTSSPPTSCYSVRLPHQDLDEVGHFRHLKIGRRSRLRERNKSPTIKDKIYLKQDLKLATIVAVEKLAERRY